MIDVCFGQLAPILKASQPKAAQHVAGAAFDVHRFYTRGRRTRLYSGALGHKRIARSIENREHPRFLSHGGLAERTNRFTQKGEIRSHPAVATLAGTRPNRRIFLWDNLWSLTSVHLHSPPRFYGVIPYIRREPRPTKRQRGSSDPARPDPF